MGNGLTGFLAGASKAQTEHDVVETRLKDAHQVLAGDAGLTLSLVEVAAELLLQNAIDELGLLLLAQLHAVLRFLTATLGLANGFLLRAVAEHDRINTELAAALKNRSSVDCHSDSILS